MHRPRYLDETLLDSRFDSDSCGVGFVAQLSAQPTHAILQHALTALARLAHRGAVAADGKSSDGVGVTTAIPRGWLLRETRIGLASDDPLGVGVIFLPEEDTEPRAQIESALADQNLEVIKWRAVPVRPEVLGEIANSSRPAIWQVLITAEDERDFDRRLYLARKQFERSQSPGYVVSISSTTIIYKALCAGRLLADFYPDLADPAFKTPFALFHQRYATNVLPSWSRAQPFRTLAHNGEINTIWGNRARMEARAATLPLDLYPVLSEGGSDSTSLDEIVELLANNGRTVGEAVRMLVPPANPGNTSAFLQYSGDCMEPWDGPAALAFTDGHQVGAILDRNGLRPCRFAVNDEGLVVAGSEAGLVDMNPEQIIHSGRLGPGQMIVADLDFHRFFENDEILRIFDQKRHYQDLIQFDVPLEDSPDALPPLGIAELNRLQHRFGFTREDVRMILAPMAAEGKDAVWSMGDDTAIAPLARAPRPLYAFFRQRFAQVTNPPIDPLREAVVLKMHTRLGPWPHIFELRGRLPGLSLRSPLITLAQMHALKHGEHAQAATMPHALLNCVYSPDMALEVAVDILASRAVELVANGASLLLLTDRGASPDTLPVPMAMATGVVHNALTKAGVRAEVGLAVDAGDCREIHHVAVLLGMGAGAVCPWLALETARDLQSERGEENLLRALELGLAKVMSKMGISVVDSYRSAHLFDAIGLSQAVVDKCFPGVPAPIGGHGFEQIDAQLRLLWAADPAPDEPAEGVGALVSATQVRDLPDYGFVRFRKADEAESHGWQPQTVRALQTVVGSTKQGAALALAPFASFAAQTVDSTPTHLRDLLEIRPSGPELALDEVEPGEAINHRF
ncbi:MAG TPA: glutamate synthase central domain-containing protein, partial [Terracidiphilus sp.]